MKKWASWSVRLPQSLADTRRRGGDCLLSCTTHTTILLSIHSATVRGGGEDPDTAAIPSPMGPDSLVSLGNET